MSDVDKLAPGEKEQLRDLIIAVCGAGQEPGPGYVVIKGRYGELYELAKQGDYIPGWLAFPQHKVSAIVKWNDPVMHIGNTVTHDDKSLFIAECTRLNLEWIAVEPPKEQGAEPVDASFTDVATLALDLTEAIWPRVKGIEQYELTNLAERCIYKGMELRKKHVAPSAREKAMEEAINNANVSIQKLDQRDLDMHKVAMMDVDDWRAIQDAARSTT